MVKTQHLNEIAQLLREMCEGQTAAWCVGLGGGTVTARGWQDPDLDLQGWIILIMVICWGHLGGLAEIGWFMRAGSSTSCCALVFFDVFTLFSPPSGNASTF